MSPGQLIHNDKFTLYEAMSCIEMMDAKMDGGRNADKSFTLEEALDQGKLPPTSSLPLPVLLFVIDKLLIAEVWFSPIKHHAESTKKIAFYRPCGWMAIHYYKLFSVVYIFMT